MSGSGTIRVLKRDGTDEAFDAEKLAGSMWRAMCPAGGRHFDACQLARAIEIYLRRNLMGCVTSTALLEMVVKVLRRAGQLHAAEAMEAHHLWRLVGRRRMRIRHEGDKITQWDKGWLGQLARRSWFLSPVTGRILAGEVEQRLLDARAETVDRSSLLDMLNRCVAEYGLADAVPVPQS